MLHRESFFFDTLPNLFLTILSTLQNVVDFVFTDYTFEVFSETYVFTPISVIFGAGIGIFGAWIIVKFFV